MAFANLASGQVSTDQLLVIQEAIQAGHLDSAQEMISSALARHPNDGGLYNLRGVTHAQKQELSAAQKDFETAVHLSPALTPAWQNLGRVCQMSDNQLPCAVNAWQHVIRSKPTDAEARQSLGLLYEKQGKYAESFAETQKIPGSATDAVLLIRCADLSGLGHFAEARQTAAILNHHGDFSEADFASIAPALESPEASGVVIALVENLDTRSAASISSLRRLAIAYEQAGRNSDARKTLERVASVDSQNPAHLLELARLAEMSKDHEGALGYLAHARDLTPQNAQIHFLWGVIAAEMDLPVEARLSLTKALEIDPDNPSYNYAMGAVIMSTRAARTAQPYFAKFIKGHPNEPQGHLALGICYFASGDYVQAKKEMAQIVNDPRTTGEAEYFLGRMARQEGDLAAAKEDLEKSIRSLSTFSESHTELGRVKMLEGDLESARGEFEQALKLDANSFEANNQLFILYKRTHDPRADQQEALLKKLDEERSHRAELMLRTIEAKPY